jgi:hypothetical protein
MHYPNQAPDEEQQLIFSAFKSVFAKMASTSSKAMVLSCFSARRA